MENTIDKIDIIIPNKSNISDLFKCLDSLIKNIDVKKYKLETIIVDDFSKKSERKDLLKKIKEYSSLNIFPIFLNNVDVIVVIILGTIAINCGKLWIKPLINATIICIALSIIKGKLSSKTVTIVSIICGI